METTALVTAIVGVVLGVASLTWQFASWQMTGPRVKVTMKVGMLGADGVVTFPVNTPGPTVRSLADQGYSEMVLAVEVRNVGRMATSVEKVSARLESGVEFIQPGDPINPELPGRLEAHSARTWYIRLQPVQAAACAAYASGIAKTPRQSARMVVALGTGKTLTTGESMILDGSRS